MKNTYIPKLLTGAVALLSVSSVSNAVILINDYNFTESPSSPFYVDTGGSGLTGGIELTDGITNTIVWGGSPIDFGPLVGWNSGTPGIIFDFAQQTVNEFTVWAADSDGAAGVALPSSIRIFDSSAGGTFDQTFAVTNPTGAGTTVPLTFSGFSVNTDQLTVELTRSDAFVMVSEVSFDNVPEPSSTLLTAASLGILAFRRKRS